MILFQMGKLFKNNDAIRVFYCPALFVAPAVNYSKDRTTTQHKRVDYYWALWILVPVLVLREQN